jgi:hypothetical protein
MDPSTRHPMKYAPGLKVGKPLMVIGTLDTLFQVSEEFGRGWQDISPKSPVPYEI